MCYGQRIVSVQPLLLILKAKLMVFANTLDRYKFQQEGYATQKYNYVAHPQETSGHASKSTAA